MLTKRKYKRMIKQMGTILIAVCLFFLLVPAGLRLLGYDSYYIMSASMEPVIDTGSLVFVNSHDKEVEVGDIVLYRLGNANIVHRIIHIQGNGELITKGDNNEVEDMEPVRNYQLVGTVLQTPWGGWCIPYAGYISCWLQAYRIYLLIIIAAGVAFGVFWTCVSSDN